MSARFRFSAVGATASDCVLTPNFLKTFPQKEKPLFAVSAASPDLYTKMNGLWYDEYEPKNGC